MLKVEPRSRFLKSGKQGFTRSTQGKQYFVILDLSIEGHLSSWGHRPWKEEKANKDLGMMKLNMPLRVKGFQTLLCY